MKHYTIRTLAMVIACCGLLASCKKEAQNIFNMFDVTLDLHSDKTNAVKEYNQVNPNDELVIDFTIKSPNKDMYMICIWRAGQGTPGIRIPITDAGRRRSYSDAITIKADQGVGTTTYRVWALDKDGVYLGDGEKQIVLEIKSDFRYMTNRNVYFPDTATKKMASFFSLGKGVAYNYGDATANAGDIDFGIYRKPSYNPTTGVFQGWIHGLYTPATEPNPFTPYDISGWTKRGTLFSAATNNGAATFNGFKTGVALETEAKKKTINLTHISTGYGAGFLFYFKTPEGKFGALLVNATTSNFNDEPYVNFSYKVVL